MVNILFEVSMSYYRESEDISDAVVEKIPFRTKKRPILFLTVIICLSLAMIVISFIK